MSDPSNGATQYCSVIGDIRSWKKNDNFRTGSKLIKKFREIIGQQTKNDSRENEKNPMKITCTLLDHM